MSDVQYSFNALEGGTSSKVAISGTSAQSVAIGRHYKAVICSDTACFFRVGQDPTAVNTGVDQYLLGNVSYRVVAMKPGDKIAFITTGATGTVYISPGA